jgi:hypothetical protein
VKYGYWCYPYFQISYNFRQKTYRLQVFPEISRAAGGDSDVVDAGKCKSSNNARIDAG